MNPILVAVDFSECSLNALEHALSFANKSESDVYMAWVHRPESVKEIGIDESLNVEEAVAYRFKMIIQKFESDFQNTIYYKILNGKVYREIVDFADEIDALMIVTGTHGASGFEEFWVGSNANKIVSSTTLPVVTIRGGIDIARDLKRVILPIDSTSETRQKILFTALLAGLFNAEIHVLSLYSSASKSVKERVDKYTMQMVDYLEEEKISYQVNAIQAENITNATIQYAERVEANLIAIMTEQERSASNILLGPYASQMVNSSPIPVLSIHPTQMRDNL